jgi:hypothetical protein
LAEVEAHGDDLTLDIIRGGSDWMPEERPALIANQASALFRYACAPPTHSWPSMSRLILTATGAPTAGAPRTALDRINEAIHGVDLQPHQLMW